ncbi:MAG: hypothetical protein AB3N20_11260 [Rhizobiaceae bacterium]
MYDHNTQATQFYLKDIERQAIDCMERDKFRSPLISRPLLAIIAASGIAIGLIGLFGSTQLI